MKRNILLATSFLLALSLSFCFSNYSFAAKKKNQGAQILVVLSNDGEAQVYGSVLSPREDEVNVFLSKTILTKIRKVGLENLNINLTSSLDSTKTYKVPSDALTINRKVLNKKAGKYLVISLFNLTTPSGITISPSSLPNDTYRLRIQGKELDATTDSFIYNTPALIVGTVDASRTGLVDVENLSGDKISEKTIATNPNGTFFTEVRADKITSKTKARKIFREQVNGNQTTADTTDNGPTEGVVVGEIHTGVVHCVTDKDLLAIVPLDNDPNNNAAVTDKPIQVDASSTLTANLALENAKQGDEELATETAKGIADNLKSNENDKSDEDITFEGGKDFECDIGNIDQFVNRCSENEDDLAAVGKVFREFITKANCNFSEFKLIKTIIPKLPDDANVFIGRGYCEINQESDENKPCEIYKDILKRFKSGEIKELPCPPTQCNEFKDIRPPKCQEAGGFCDQTQSAGPPQPFDTRDHRCIHKSHRDLYCAQIGTDIKSEECKDDESFGGFSPGWVIKKNSKGNEYCVPSNIPKPQYPLGYTGPLPPSTPEEIAEECEVNACHNQCSVKFGFNHGPIPPGSIYPGSPLEAASQGLSDCHFACDAEAGKVADCGNPLSKYFKKDCCNTNTFGPVLYTQSSYLAQTSSPGFPQGGFGGGSFGGGNFGGFGHGPMPPDTRGCLCLDPNNFNEKGFVKEDAQNVCKNSCPKGYEKDPNSDSCLQICPEGAVRDVGGICRKKCPEGFIQDDFGNCKCPPDQFVGQSGKCESSSCPSYCKNYTQPYSTSTSFGSTPGGYNSIPPECQKCLGGGGPGSCSPNSKYDPATHQCVPTTQCGPNQSADSTGACRCPDGTLATSLGPEGCKNQNNICGNSNMYPNPSYTPGSNQAQCICPDGLSYWETNYNPTPGSGGGRCVAHCSNGDPPASTSTNYPSKSPIPCSGGGGNTRPCTAGEGPSNNCYCFGSGWFVNSDGKCQCSASGVTYTGGGCGNSQGSYCPIGQGPSNGCQCNTQGGTIVGSNGQCQCPSGSSQSYSPASGCGSSSTNYCAPGIVPTAASPCTCNPSGGAYFSSSNTCTCPTNSGPYTKEYGCGSSQFTCPAPYIKDPAFPQSCICSSSVPYELGGTCVAQCPGGTTPSTTPGGPYNSTRQTCKCPDGTYPTSDGKCGTSSTNYCSPGIAIGTNGCTCNLTGGTLSTNGFCGCPSGSNTAYTKETGCSSTSRPCTAGEGPSNGCYCFGSGYTGSDGKCQCSGGVTYTGGGCGSSQGSYCPIGQGPSNGCQCNTQGGTIVGSNGQCQCPSGSSQSYSPASGCGTSTSSHVCAVGEAATTTNPCYCASGATFTGPNSTGTCQCPNNNTPAYTTAGCGGTTTRPCTAGEGPSNGCYCFGSGYTGSDGKCQCSGGVTYTGGGCGTSTSSHVCAAGEAATTTNPCYCASGATFTGPSGTGTCQCPNNNTPAYTAAGCGSTASHTCAPGEVPTASNPCTCATGASFGTGNTCQCPSGQTYYVSGCQQQCTGGQILDPATNTCRCPNNQVLTNGTCQCPVGMQPDPNSSSNCVACTACTGGKGFFTQGCTCTCPAGKTENASGQCQ